MVDCSILTDDELDKEMLFLSIVIGVTLGILLGVAAAVVGLARG